MYLETFRSTQMRRDNALFPFKNLRSRERGETEGIFSTPIRIEQHFAASLDRGIHHPLWGANDSRLSLQHHGDITTIIPLRCGDFFCDGHSPRSSYGSRRARNFSARSRSISGGILKRFPGPRDRRRTVDGETKGDTGESFNRYMLKR